jgi:hypothetical protein
MRRGRTIWCITVVVVVVGSIAMPSLAWARYRSAGSETNTFATHVLLAPGRPSCSGLGILSVTLSWTAPSDAAFVLSYELGKSGSPGGPYTYTNVGTATSASPGISSGDQYFVVRTVNQAWRGSISPERRVNGLLFLVATCP